MSREQKPGTSMGLYYADHPGPLFLDPFLSVNPCCCCCGVVPIVKGVQTTATISLVLSAGYLIMGCWFAFKALLVSDQPLLGGEGPSILPPPVLLEESDSGVITGLTQSENLVNLLLICGLTSLTGGSIRFLSSLYLLKTAEKESKTPAKVWLFLTFGFIILVTAVVLWASQRDASLFASISVDIFLLLCLIDFILLLYFLWVIIVWVKEAIDMPGL